MDFRILGPLEVGDPPIVVGGGKARALLAVLVLNAGRTVARSRLIDDLWGEVVPDTAVKMVQIHVSQLRKALGPDLLVTRAPGYALDVSPDRVDLHRAEALLNRGRAALQAGDARGAAAGLREALALWRGPALAEFEEPFAALEAARIEELGLSLSEERIDADLALGGHAAVVGELETLVARHPLRERLRAQLMVALYRCGRQADALALFQQTRRALGEDLGLEPSPALRELERRILRQDPGLDAAPAPAPAGGDRTGGSPAPSTGSPAREEPPVRYARSGDLSIAYEVAGRGPPDLVLVPGFVSHLRMDRAHPAYARFLDRLAGFARLIRFDKRGTGLSDRPVGLPDLETRMDDVRAVMDDAGSRRAVLLGYSEGGPLSALVAATHPDRVAALVLVNSYAKRTDPDADYPWATPRELRSRMIADLEQDWGYQALGAALCPSADDEMRRWWAERCRAAASPGAARALSEMNARIDVRDVLPTIRVPTLVVHRGGDLRVVPGHGRYLAERIPGARFVEIPGVDHFVGVDPDTILDVVEPWVRALPAAAAAAGPPERAVLATVLAVSGADESAVRREVARSRGRLGEGIALFDGPTRAIRCALAIVDALPEARAGLHTGEVTGTSGPAIGDAVALAAAARAGQVLVTSTTRDLVPGAGLRFEDRGERRLTGGAVRRVFAVGPGGGPVSAPAEPAPVRAAAPARAPFAGRRREMAVLQAALADALAGTGRLVMLAGEPGIGKTRIAAELATRAAGGGALVLRGRAHEREGAPPYWPWSQALGQLVAASHPDDLRDDAGEGAADIAGIAPALGAELGDPPAAPPSRDAEQARFRLLQAVACLLRASGARRPLVVVLEDLHAADTGTLRLLECVARELPEARILIVGTYRDTEVAAGHPLEETLAELTREGLLERIALGGLGPGDVEIVLGAAAGSAPPAALLDAALSQTEGNPLFVTELARLLRQAGAGDAGASEDGWALRIPEGVRSVIGLRLARLSEGCAAALRMAAVLGRELGVRELGAALGDPSGGGTLSAVDEAIAARVLEEVEGAPGRVVFSHGLIREVLLERMGAPRRAHLSAQVLRVLQDLYGDGAPAHAAELLHHAEQAEPVLGPEPVAQYALQAGAMALDARAYEEAADLHRRALAALGGTDADPRAADAHFGLGRALLAARELHELDEAVASLALAFDLRARAGNREGAIAVATHPIPPHLHLEAAGATRLVERAIELVDPSSADASRLLSSLGWLTGICRADAEGARAAFDRAVAIARELDLPDLEVRSLVQRQYVEMFHLEWDECHATGLRAIELAVRTGDRRDEMAARGWVARALARTGDLAGARRQAAAATPHAENLRERYWRATAGLHNAMLAELAGDWAAAREWTDAALAARPRDPRALGLRALVEHQTGELTEGAARVARLCAPLEDEPVPGPGAEHPFAAAHVPLCHRIGGVDDRSRAAAERAGHAVLGLRAAPPYLLSLAHIGLGLWAAADGDAAGAAVHRAALARYGGTASVIPPVSMDRLLCVMALAEGDVAGAVVHGRDAVAFCERAGYLPELAWAARDLAVALAEGDATDEAAALRERAQSIAREIGMHALLADPAPTP